MIKELHLENFIIVSRLDLEFDQGLQVLSGETGAGKSIIAGAISLILGGQTQSGMLQDETKPAVLEAVFDTDKTNKLLLKLVEKYDIDTSEDEFFLRREISTNYRSKSFLNGRRVANAIIQEFRDVLLDFHSQRDQQRLFDRDYQLEVLDIYGDLEAQREAFSQSYQELENDIKELNHLEQQEKEQADRIQLFQYQIGEIEAMQLQPDEAEMLQSELNLLNHSEAILNLTNQMEQVVYENENSIYDQLNYFTAQLAKYEEDNELIKEAVNSLQGALVSLDDAISGMRNIQSAVNLDGSRLEEVQNRLDSINAIASKYKKTVAEILEYQAEMQQEIDNYSSNQEKIIELKNRIENHIKNIVNEAEKLSEKRQKAASKFAAEIEENIKKLAIPDARIKIQFEAVKQTNAFSEELTAISSNGKDLIDIYFSANKGIKLQPFRIAASGGELSRFLLCIKKILSDRLDKRTIIFDEIDAGIGGKTSELLAEFIHNIGKFHQIICISHLPQIAAYADQHFAIIKKNNTKFADVEVKLLTNKQRQIEIARMLSGSQSELALRHAEELILKSKERG